MPYCIVPYYTVPYYAIVHNTCRFGGSIFLEAACTLYGRPQGPDDSWEPAIGEAARVVANLGLDRALLQGI